MAGANSKLTFRIFQGDQLLREESLNQNVIKIGKLSSAHLRLDDPSVSRMHAVIEVTGDDEISIIDLGSAKGTFVNGQKVNKAKLQSGDEITVGDLRIEFAVSAAAAEPAVAPAPSPAPAPAAAPPAAPPSAPPAARAPTPPPVAPPSSSAPASSTPPTFSVPAPAPSASPSPSPSSPRSASPTAPPNFGADAAQDMGGARAIEIAAMLGDSVVGIKHVMSPKGGKISTATWAMFGVGAVLLILSAFAFNKGISTAEHNKESKHAWVEVERKPFEDWRPVRISMMYDWLAFGGLVGGLFLCVYGLVRYRNEQITPFFKIGTDPGVDFPTENSPHASFPLVAPVGDDFVLNFGQGMDGELMLDGQSTPLGDLMAAGRARQSGSVGGATEVPIPPKARFRISTGIQTFLVSSVPQPRHHAVPLFSSMDTTVMAFLGASTLFFSGFLALLLTIPPDPKSLSLDSLGDEDRLSSVQSKAQEDPKEEEEEEEADSVDSGGTGTKMALDSGKMGTDKSTRQSGQFAMKNNDADPQLARQQVRDQAAKAGVLGLIPHSPGGAFASLTGTADFSSGIDDRDVYGGLIGNEVGEMQGGFGYGVSGVGPGGGGTGWGTVGKGNYGKIGHGAGTGTGFGTGSGRGGLRGRKSRAPEVRIGNASATGDLDKNIIRRYIRRRLPRIRACYEKQLLVKPALAGTVVTNFQISPNGSVQGSRASGIGDKTVESCVAAAVGSIQFPKPKGGGYVQVRYPFHFRSSGGN